MMISYPGLAKLKTKPIVYEDVLLASDPGTLEHLKELSSTRKAIEESINDNSQVTEAIAREMSGGLTSRCEQDIQKLEQYLPLLETLVCHIKMNITNQRMISWILDLKITWNSVLNSSSIFQFKCSKLHQVNDIHFELGMSLFLYGAMIRERALEVSSSDLVQATTLLRKAAGVYDYLAQEVLVHLNHVKDRTPEAMPRLSSIMSLICLAEAQAVTARKAEEKGNTDSLLAKLHYGITEILFEAIDMLQASNEPNDIPYRLWHYIFSCKALHELKSYKYTAEGLEKDGKIGVAIGVLRLALSNAKKYVPKEEPWRLVFKQVTNDLSVVLRKYERENEFVWNEKVPCDYDLPSPRGVKIVSVVPYQPQKWERKLVFKL